MRTLLVALAACGLAFIPVSVRAADPPPVELARQVRAIAAEIRAIRAMPSLDQDDRMQQTIAFASRRQRFFLIYAVLRKQSGVVLTPTEVLAAPTGPHLSPVEQARTDVQAGATSASSGSSSLVSKGSAPAFFGVAMENGAFTQTVGGTTTTLQGNVVGIFDLLGSRGYLAAYDDSAATRFLRRVSFSLTVKNDASAEAEEVDVDTAAAPSPVTPSIRDQLKQFDRRIEAYSVRAIVGRNRRDPRDGDNIDALTRLMGAQAQGVLASLDDALGDLQVSDRYTQWITDSVAQLKRVPQDFLEAALLERLNVLSDVAHMIDPRFDENSLTALHAYSAFLARRDRLIEEVEKKKLFAVEYVRTRQLLQEDLVTYRFIAEAQKGRWDLTANAAYRGYDRHPAGGGPLYRDMQFAADATTALGDRTAPGKSPLGNAALSLALLYERLFESSTVTFGDRVFAAEPGHLFIGQFKVTLPIKNAGVKVPLSVSVANRTELLDEKEIRANLGFTFNYDVIASLFRK